MLYICFIAFAGANSKDKGYEILFANISETQACCISQHISNYAAFSYLNNCNMGINASNLSAIVVFKIWKEKSRFITFLYLLNRFLITTFVLRKFKLIFIKLIFLNIAPFLMPKIRFHCTGN